MNLMSEWFAFLAALEDRLDEILAQSPQLAQHLAETLVHLKHAGRFNRRLLERCFEEALRPSSIGSELFGAAFGSEAVARRKALASVDQVGLAAEFALTEEQRIEVVGGTRQLLEKVQRRQRSGDREITVTGHTLHGAPASRFTWGETYKLRFQVGPPSEANLASGDTSISGVPSGGLKTRWMVTSADVEFVPGRSSAAVKRIGETWLAEFDLLIPESGTSKTEEVAFRAGAQSGSLRVSIYAVSAQNTRELFREVSVSLARHPEVKADITCKALRHTHLGTTHEWTKPPEQVHIQIQDSIAIVLNQDKHFEDYYSVQPWHATAASISGAITNVRASLEKLREDHTAYLDDLEHSDIAIRLQMRKWEPYFDRGNGWQPLPDEADADHKAAFGQVEQSDAWRALAHNGYALFSRCFPPGPLRDLIKKLLPGSRIDFNWTDQSGAGVVLHIPWALMYLEPVSATGSIPIDPEKFLGLRFRIGSRSWGVRNGSVLLGELDKAHSLHLLYWGDRPDDEVATEARWQASEYGKWRHSRLLPDASLPDRRQQILLAIEAPTPSPVGVLYFYCHCSVGDGNETCLRFGNTSQKQDTIRHDELPQMELPDGPLVFANACSTSHADPHMASELEQSFFERGVRAFVGTETKVPIKLASKFAWLYFQFFNRMVDPAPMTAGEALAQARLFLWTQFKNVGGLFYSITNQYDLHLASEQEIESLRQKRK